MNDIHQLLAETEDKVAKLTLQAQQEAAMVEVLPLRFEQNMSAFKKYIPHLADKFKSYKTTRPFRFFCNENGEVNLLWLDTNVSFYGDSPFDECRSQIEQVLSNKKSIHKFGFGIEENEAGYIHVDYLNKLQQCQKNHENELVRLDGIPDSIPLIMMFGIGLGYQLGYLYEKCKAANLFIFEPDMDLFYASLYSFDWHSLFDYLVSENLGLHIFIGQDEDNVILDFSEALTKRGAFIAAASIGFWHYPSDDIFKLIVRTSREFYLLTMGWGFFDDNIIALAHCAANVDKNIPFLIKNKSIQKKWEDTPVFVVANGPSLDGSLDVIRKYRDNVILICCGSTLTSLYRAGICPDIHVQVERTKVIPDSHRLINDDEYMKKIMFLSLDVIHPDCAEQFGRSALAFKLFEPGGFLCQLNNDIAAERDILPGANPLVGNTGLAIACRLGFKNIFLFGLDNGYKDLGHHHSKHSLYFDDDGKPQKDLTEKMFNNAPHIVDGNFGGAIHTNSLMNTSRKVLGELLKKYDDVSCFNCSDGAKIEGAIPLHQEELNIKQNHLNRVALLDHIYNDLYSPMNIKKEDMYQYLEIEKFSEFVNVFIDEWSNLEPNRENALQLMQKQYDGLIYLSKTRQRIIYNMLVGTFNYAFSIITGYLYTYEESDEFNATIKELGSIFQNYLREAIKMYPHSIDMVDSVDSSVVSLFRKN
jgi:Uncharacterized protein conserved in bacteria